MKMAKSYILNIVATECPPENEARFNKWYNEVHIPMLLKYKGIKKVTRYQLSGEAKGQAKFLALYEFADKKSLEEMSKSKEFAAAIEEMQGTWKGEGFSIKWTAVYEPIKTWER
jgi:antibiotic biosynthesis monooxygenase (ABM) superfamily enzyme